MEERQEISISSIWANVELWELAKLGTWLLLSLELESIKSVLESLMA